MMKRNPLSSRALAPFCLMALGLSAWAQEANEKAQRYYDSLLKRPVPGAAFDRFYGAWLDTETLESLEKWLIAKADAPNAPAGARLLLAYFYSRQSEPVKAIAQFNKALAKDPGNAEAWYQKAMASARLLDSATALKDLDKATQAKPSKLLAAQIRQAQGRLLARQGQPEEARKVWQELMAANPDDEDLAEDLIDLQITEGLYDDALASTTKLLERTKDAYKKIQRRLRLGEIYLKSGKRDEAVKVWRSCLEDTGSDSWLEKEILAQLEQAFRREDAMEPLMKEMADLSAKYPQRLTLRRQYAKLLAETGDIDGAVKVYRGILELTPGERSTREGFIDLLKENKRPAEAAEQLQELVKLNPKDLELLARLADLEAENGDKAKAQASMELFLTKSDQSEASWLRVAAALERYGLPEEALAQYQRTAEKFPDSEGVREAWAVALHSQGKKEEAIKVWRELAKGADGTRLASVARSASARGEHGLAYELLKEREPDFAKDPVFLTLLCDEAAQLEKPAEALPWALLLVKMSKDAVDLESTVSRCLKLADQAEKTDDLRAQLQAGTLTPQEKCLLAELLDRHADPKAADALLKEVAATEPELATAQLVRLQGQRNDNAGAADSLKKLVESPGGRKSVHVQRLVELYRRAGKPDEALAWIPEWKKLSPGSVLPWQTEAELQFDAGKGKEALKALRQASQEFEGNEDIRAQLASAYQSEGQLADAQRIYMALYEDAADTSARIRWAGAMADVAKDAGKTEDLIETFEQRHKANKTSLAPLLALAEIYRVTDNYDGRRKTLLEAVRVKPGDVELLMEIARISEREEKYDDALETLREAAPLDKSGKVRQLITRVLFEAGREEEGMQGLRESFTGPPNAQAVENVADSLVSQDLWGRAADFLLEQLPNFPDNYRLYYYCAVALEQDGRIGGEFDPGAVDTTEKPADSPSPDGKTASGPRSKTGAMDLFLKLRTMTRELAPAALPPVTGPAAPKAGPDFYGELAKDAPAQAVEVMRLSAASYQAYQYRQRNQRQRGGVGLAGTGLSVPPQLQAVRSMALAHLISLNPQLSVEGRAKLVAELGAGGLPQPAWLIDSGIIQINGGGRQVDFSEPLEKDPDNEALNAMQVLWSSGNASVTGSQLLKSLQVLREHWPVMARLAALGLIRGDSAEEQAEFGKVVDELAALEKPPGVVLMNGVTQALYQLNNRRGFTIPDANRAKFASLQNRILPWLRADSQQRQNLGYIFLQLAAGLAEGGDLTPLVKMLDEEIAYWATDPDKKSAMSRLPVYGSNQVPPVIQELPFPPEKLPDFPPQVLQVLNGQGLRMYGMSLSNDSAQWKTALAAAKDPVLRVLIAQAAEDEGEVRKAVEALNAGKEPNVTGILLAAALAGKNEKYAEAVDWLRKAQDLPVPRDIRRSMDSATLAWTLKALENAPAPGAADDPLRLAGRESALRLRRENLNAGQKSELADAFEALGLEREAERMTASAAASPSGPRGMVSSSGMMMASARNRSQLQMLVDKGKRPEAVKSSLKQLRDFARTWVGGNDGSVRYVAQEWVQDVRRSSLLRDLQEALKADTREDAASLAQRGAAWDILGDTKTAVPLYKKSLELKPKDAGVQSALALALLTQDPKEAMPIITGMDAAQFAGMTNVLQNMSDRFETFEARFALLEAVTAILDRLTPEQAAKQDLTWALYLMETVMQQGYSSKDQFQIGSLYEENEPDQNGTPGEGQKAKIEALRKRRLALHDQLCRRMMLLPGLAEPAFRRFAGVTLDQKLSTPTPEELDALALQVLQVEAKQRNGITSANRRYYYSNNKAIRLPSPVDWLLERAWRKKDPSMITAQMIPLLRQAGGTALKDMEQQQALYFCADADFQKTVGDFLKRRQNNSPGGEAGTYLETALRIMNLRGLDADFTNALVESVEALNSSYFGGQELSPVLDYADYLMDKKGPAETRALLSRIATAVLGPKNKRQDFVTKNYQTNGFNSPQGMMIYRWIQMLRTGLNRPALVLPLYEQMEEELMPYVKNEAANQSVLTSYGSAFQRSGALPDKPEDFLKFLKATPLTGDAAGFRSYPDKRQSGQSPVVELLKQLAQHPKRKELAAAVGTLPKTFGTDLIAAALNAESGKLGEGAAAVLGAHLEEIKKLPPERWVNFTVIRKGLAGDAESDAAKAFDAWARDLQSENSGLEVEKLLSAKDAGELAPGDGQLSAWFQPVLTSLITSGDPRLSAAVVKMRSLVAAERKARGQNQTGANDGSSVLGRVLSTVLNQGAALSDPAKATRSLSGLLKGLADAQGFPIEWSRNVSTSMDRLLRAAVLVTVDQKSVTRLKEFAETAELPEPGALLLFGPLRRLLSTDTVSLSPEDKSWLDSLDPAATGIPGVILAAKPPAAPQAWLAARIADPALPLAPRLGLAVEALRLPDIPSWSTVAAAVNALTETWKAGQPVTDPDAGVILEKFNTAAKDPAVPQAAARAAGIELAAAWRKTLAESTRGPGSYGYRPLPAQRGAASRAFLSLFLTLQDTNGLNALLAAMGPQVDRGWLAELVAKGQEETARRLLSPMRPGLQARGNDSVKFSRALAEHLPAFLAGITDERTRILTEAMLVSLPDPGESLPEQKKTNRNAPKTPAKEPAGEAAEAKAKEEMKGLPDRRARLATLLEHLPLDSFKTRSELEPLVVLLNGEEGLSEKMTALVNRYVEGDSLAAASLVDDQYQRELRCGLLRREVIRKLKAGDIPAVEETLRDLEETLGNAQNYYAREQAGLIYPLLHDAITSSWQDWKPETRQLVRSLWLSLSLDSEKLADISPDADSQRLMLALFLYALEDDMKAFTAVVKNRPAETRENFAARLRKLDLKNSLAAVKYPWSGSPNEVKARKAALFLRMISQPAALPGWKGLESVYFRTAEEYGWTSGADILAKAGELLEKGPQDSSLPAELAVLQADNGQAEAAAGNLVLTQSRLAPDDHNGAAKVILLRSTLLEKQGKAAEAFALLSDFKAAGDLDDSLKQTLTSRAADLKLLATLQTEGPEKLIAAFIPALTEKPDDAEQWMKLEGALTVTGQYLMDKKDPAAAANHFGMAAVIVSKLAARDPKKYTDQLHLPARGWQAAAKAAKLPGAPRTLVENGSVWKYSDAPAEGWAKTAFDDKAWKSGPAPIGYGDSWLKTNVSPGEGGPKPFTLWLRTGFDTQDVSGKLSLDLQRDDGAVIYLNGQEIARSNLPGGDLKADTPALQAIQDQEERKRSRILVKARDLLVPGHNVLAVELHQNSPDSSDLSLDLALNADDLEPWQAVQKLDAKALASALGNIWSQLPAGFRNQITGGEEAEAGTGTGKE